MSNLIDIIIKEVEAFNNSIKDSLAAKKINNTKEASNSLRIEIEKNKDNFIIRSIGIFYLEFLDTGRGNGKFPPITPIRLWVAQKLGITEETQNKQVAFLIARKIARLGTEIFKNNSEGIELDKKVLNLRKTINDTVRKEIKTEITQKLDRFKKRYVFNLSK